MKEELLQYIWKMKVVSPIGLNTTSGLPLDVIDFGTINDDQGPDFLNGKILLDGIEFAGSIEIHINGSHWIQHKHAESRLYDNVILHVVYNHDQQIFNLSDQPLPTLELKNLIQQPLLDQYEKLMRSRSLISCEQNMKNVSAFNWIEVKDRMFAERLDRKLADLKSTLIENNFDWEETFYAYLFKYAAMGVNSNCFFELAQSIPLKIIRKIGNVPFTIEAIYFGQANLLEQTDSTALRELRGEYEYQKLKYGLNKNYFQMKFSRMRPANFPDARLSQLVLLLANNPYMFRAIIEATSLGQITDVLNIEPYLSNVKRMGPSQAKLGFGQILIQSLIVNVVVPIMYLYGKELDNSQIIDRAKSILDELKSEKNKITRIWAKLDVECKSAYDSQALTQLYKEYCSAKKCLNCSLSTKALHVK